MELEETKLIFSPQLAKYLILKNYRIVDLKQKKESPKETVFVFKNDVGLEDEILRWKSLK